MNELDKQELLELEKLSTGFEVNDLDTFNWTLRKISVLKKAIKENNDLAAKEYERIDSWLKQANKSSLQPLLLFS